jgi:hypothetical protein
MANETVKITGTATGSHVSDHPYRIDLTVQVSLRDLFVLRTKAMLDTPTPLRMQCSKSEDWRQLRMSEPARQAVSQLRRWCPYSETHCDAAWIDCPWDGCGPNELNRGHRLRLRRMLVCSVCQQGYFNQKEFNEHECYSAY